jgi:hypothetical protein
MSTGSPNEANGTRATGPYRTNPGQEASEQLLALADKIGGAYAEAYQQLNASYSEAFHKLAVGMAGLQGGLPDPQALSAMMDPSSLTDRLDGAQEHALAVGENLAEMGIEIGLACLRAVEEATVAVANCQERITAASRFDLFKSAAATHAELVRKVARAGASTIREIAD